MKLSIICLTLLVMMVGCIPDPLPVDDISSPPTKVVVSSQLVPGIGLVVFVSKSVGALEAGWRSDTEELIEKIAISDAVVTLLHNGTVYSFENNGTGVYTLSKDDFVSGNSYELHVETPELGNVSSVTTVAERVVFDSVTTSLFKMGRDSLVQVDYSLSDPLSKNYYMVCVQRYSQKMDVNSLLNPRMYIRLTEDTEFNGKQFEDSFRTLFQRFSKGDTVAVTLANVSEDYFKYLKLRNDRYRFSEFSSEPFNYPSNVNNGLGYFNLHSYDARIFVME